MENIYINAYALNKTTYCVDLETFIILNIYKIAQNNIQIKAHLVPEQPKASIKIDITSFGFDIEETCTTIAGLCNWPVIVQGNYAVAGLCSVSRQIIKHSQNEKTKKLLGFRDACLMACSESSIWTKFCEVDMISSVKKALLSHSSGIVNLPEDFARFEFHLAQPVRMHNIYKIAREQNQVDLAHTFAEGPFMTLSDVILFYCAQIYFKMYPEEEFKDQLPLTLNWFSAMKQKNLDQLSFHLDVHIDAIKKILVPEIVKQSLYTADPSRYKPEKRIFTKQKDIINSLKIISANIDTLNGLVPYGDDVDFDWSKIPSAANPVGALPQSRSGRKCQQLENLAKAVMKIAKKPCKIVDFCSGSGHLGILIAHLLPQCTVILVENKEVSLVRAKERVLKLQLDNVVLLQCNLDYFVGSFDVGVSLHACGVATDLVIQNCIKNGADFVCCPCCYGGIHDCYHLTYPRSIEFRDLKMDLKAYLTLAHAADQTHDPDNVKTTQGFTCMDAIDTDRKLYAESCGYEVRLGKLQPVTCTNKNNLLVGICNR